MLENIDENSPANWLPLSCAPPPETPVESLDFLARSWSLSAMELAKAISTTLSNNSDNSSVASVADGVEIDYASSAASQRSVDQPLPDGANHTISPRVSEEIKELFFLNQALDADFLSSQQLLKNGLYKSMMRGKTMGRWFTDQKERKKQESRAHNAELHAAVSVASVAAAVAASAASSAPSFEIAANQLKAPSGTSAAIASAAALVASHCIDIAEEMGADHDQLAMVVNSAIRAKSNGDIMTLTAGAATALRAAATLKARLQKSFAPSAFALTEEKNEKSKATNVSEAIDFVTTGGELLKRTRKGDLHWKEVSIDVNSKFQVMAKMKSRHIAGTFTKKKKCIISEVHTDIQAWPGREKEDGSQQRAYFGIKTDDRIIEFECRKGDKEVWTEGIQQLLKYCTII